MKVAFFPGCMVDMFYPEIGIAAVNVLERLGCEVEMPEEQVCCGQGLLNSGYAKETVPVAKNILDAYDLDEYETIVSLTGSCMNAIINDYPTVLEDVEYLHKVERIRPHRQPAARDRCGRELPSQGHLPQELPRHAHARHQGAAPQAARGGRRARVHRDGARRALLRLWRHLLVQGARDFGRDREGEVRDYHRDGRRRRVRSRRALPHEHQGRACAPACAGCGRP